MNIFYKDNNAGTTISIINLRKLNPYWENENKAPKNKNKRRHLVQTS